MVFIYRWTGEYFGFISEHNLFDANSNWIGWIKDRKVWQANGKFLGEIYENNYILRRKAEVPPVPRVPHPPPMLPIAPDPPVNRAARVRLAGWKDALKSL